MKNKIKGFAKKILTRRPWDETTNIHKEEKENLPKKEKGITGFLKRLDREGEVSGSGEVGGFDAKAKYGYFAKVGTKIKDFFP